MCRHFYSIHIAYLESSIDESLVGATLRAKGNSQCSDVPVHVAVRHASSSDKCIFNLLTLHHKVNKRMINVSMPINPRELDACHR